MSYRLKTGIITSNIKNKLKKKNADNKKICSQLLDIKNHSDLNSYNI